MPTLSLPSPGREPRVRPVLRSAAASPRPGLATKQACSTYNTDCQQRDEAFVALLDAYRPTGGLLRMGELASLLLARRTPGCEGSLADSIASRETLAFEWGGTTWVPAFQKIAGGMDTEGAASRVLAELSVAFDDWSAAHWFVALNPWLVGRMPIELLKTDVHAVLDAARADRFAARG